MVGSAADAATAAAVARACSGRLDGARLHNLVGRTDLPTLAGVLTLCRTLVTNDSGAMHLAAAAGVSVTAVFGPTDDTATRPLGDAHAILTHPGLVPALHAARVPARSSVHARRRRRRRCSRRREGRCETARSSSIATAR